MEAVNYLINSNRYAALASEIRGIVKNWDTHPMAYSGHLSCLNALVDVGIESSVKFERLMTLVESKRRLIPEAKRREYQRVLMQERRARERNAVTLRELQRGPLVGAAKAAYLKDVRARWSEARDKFLTAKGDDLTWEERNNAAGEFWAGIDETLEANLAAERRKKLAS